MSPNDNTWYLTQMHPHLLSRFINRCSRIASMLKVLGNDLIGRMHGWILASKRKMTLLGYTHWANRSLAGQGNEC